VAGVLAFGGGICWGGGMTKREEKEYIIFCDESDKKGTYYSNFYGGVLVGASEYERISRRLNGVKAAQNLYQEVKWERVTALYWEKYAVLIRAFMEEVRAGNLKIRIMFRQNANVPRFLNHEQKELEYFLLYYQFIKHAFGLRYSPRHSTKTQLRIYLDELPDTSEKAEQFKGFLLGLDKDKGFRDAQWELRKENITEVDSSQHVLMQCLDIVLGSMAFRLNDKHKAKPEGHTRRGKRTIAKEKLYKVILHEIRTIIPHFNIGISTGRDKYSDDTWTQAYRHWSFKREDSDFDRTQTKRGSDKRE
jgi:hypothetical protein